MLSTLSYEQKIEVFGDFTPYINEEGLPNLFWEEEILTTITMPASLPLSWDNSKLVRNIRCHKKIARFLLQALNDVYSYPVVWETINDYGGCYNFRLQRKSTNSLSSHCWGIAIDLDVGDNPFGRTPIVHPKLVDIFETNGFVWGGNFKRGRIDGMHFEFSDLRKLT
jgi:hypothetical protein